MLRNFRLVGFPIGCTGVVLLLSLLANPARADEDKEEDKDRRGHGHMWADAMFERMDADDSGSVSKEEFENAFKKMRDRIHKYREGRHRRDRPGTKGSHGRKGGKGEKRAGRRGGGHPCPHCRRGAGRSVVHVHHHHYYAAAPQARHHGPRGYGHGHRHGPKFDGKGYRKGGHRRDHHPQHEKKRGDASDSAYQFKNEFDDTDSLDDTDSEVQDAELASADENPEIPIGDDADFLAFAGELDVDSFDLSDGADQAEFEHSAEEETDEPSVDESVDQDE